MNKKRAEYLIDFCKEQEIRVDQAMKDGKIVPDLTTIRALYSIQREILNHVRQNLGGG